MNRCITCARPITASFKVCRKCEERYGLGVPFKEWPEWAKRLYYSKRAEYLQDVRSARDVSYNDDLSLEELSLGQALELVQEGELDPQDVADCDPIWTEYDA